jgi:ATP-dependent exoDNAse (exonuclease V) beta subunit
VSTPTRTPEQQRAIERRDRGIFLEAGAGTGKTHVLVGRYCDAVSEDEVATDAILAFTFTERAAGQLRSRIRAELLARSRAAEAAGEGERGAALALRARDSERAWISTIHAFCRRLLTTQPIAAGIDPRFRVLDAAEAGRMADRAFDLALDELTLEREAATLIAAGFHIPRLRELVRGAYEQFRGQAIADPRLPPALSPASANGDGDEPGLSEAELAEIRDGYEAIRELFAGFGRHYATLKAQRSGLDFEDLQLRALDLLRSSPAAAELWQGRFEHILVDEFQDTNRLQVALIRELQGPETKLFVVGDELQSIYGFRHADIDAFRDERRLAAETPDSEREVLPLSGSFRSDPDVIAGVNAIGELLIAGYRPLAAGRVRDSAAPAAGTGPRVELLLTAAKGWDEEGIALDSASESTPAHVAEARALAARLAELVGAGVSRGDIVVLLRAFTHVAAFEEALGLAGLRPHVLGGRGYWSHQQVEDVICLLSAVANPLDDEPLLGALSSPACGASADALWLLRRLAGDRRHIWPALADHFGDEQAPVPQPRTNATGGDASTSNTNGVGEQGSLLDLLEVDEDAEREQRYLPQFDEADRDRLEQFHRRLTAIRDLAPLLPLEELCDRVVREFEYDLATLARDGGAQRMANVRKLMRLAREFEAREGRDLRRFLDYAASRAAAADAEGQAATQAEGIDGVRVMTVHAAKGLEFPVVAAADLGRDLLIGGVMADVRVGRVQAGSDTPEIGLRLIRPGEDAVTLGELSELADRDAEAGSEESLRLAHVAFTRAEERLLLSGLFSEKHLERPEKHPHGASVIARLLPELGVSGEDGQVIATAAPEAREGLDADFEPAEILVRVSAPSPERAVELGLRQATAGAGEELPPALTPPLAELREPSGTLPLRPLSYSALSDYARCGYRFYVERVMGIRSLDSGIAVGNGAAGGSARDHRLGFGNAVHRLLEWSARNRWAAPGRELCATAFADEGLAVEDEDVERALAMLERWLGSELRGRLDRPLAGVHPEAAFLLDLDGTVIRGQMDLLVDGPGEIPLVVDYKTDALRGGPAEERMPMYETQRDLYALAASEGLARRTGGEPSAVRTAYAFLDSDGPPLERTYDAAALAQTRTRLQSLVNGIRAGAFEVTAAPHRGLCLECPARERLCSWPSEATLAEAPGVAAG